MMSNQSKSSAARDHAMHAAVELGLWIAALFIIQAQQLSHPWLGILSFLVQVYVIFCAYQLGQHYKVTECDGRITYGGAFRYIMWLGVFSSLIVAPITFVYLQWIDTNYLPFAYDLIVSETEKLKVESGLNVPAELFEAFRQVYTPIRYAIYSIFSNIFSSVFWALLLALPISRRDSRFNDLFKQDKNDNNDNDELFS